MEALKVIGGIALWLAVVAVGFLLVGLWFYGVAWATAHLFPWLTVASVLAFALSILVFLPLALFRRARHISAYALLLISYCYGLTLWFYGFVCTLVTWGAGGLIAALILTGGTIVPAAVIATALAGQWQAVGVLIVGALLTFGTRMVAVMLAQSYDNMATERFYEDLIGNRSIEDLTRAPTSGKG